MIKLKSFIPEIKIVPNSYNLTKDEIKFLESLNEDKLEFGQVFQPVLFLSININDEYLDENELNIIQKIHFKLKHKPYLTDMFNNELIDPNKKGLWGFIIEAHSENIIGYHADINSQDQVMGGFDKNGKYIRLINNDGED